MRIKIHEVDQQYILSALSKILDKTYPQYIDRVKGDLTYQERISIESLVRSIKKEMVKKVSSKKTASARKATQTRVNKAKEKIENAVNMLRLRNIEITTYTVTQESGCSFNTCKKYKEFWEK